ncbi:hypothetical protein BC939DRAFT_446248 [Gamsiella multidivaricata]|uniref:uncharacterized protein n=1 Tax=Gamsiella multidivaricata TaxID=101098 RepID=UPI00221ECA22|nr:uncharacterized protein BC939DRAFT_446248 [Gamsiella multidivaricata]KAI7826933.1 hypothetical protein BC939DRAFT_446248 [Gamsiella multidivaricata]
MYDWFPNEIYCSATLQHVKKYKEKYQLHYEDESALVDSQAKNLSDSNNTPSSANAHIYSASHSTSASNLASGSATILGSLTDVPATEATASTLTGVSATAPRGEQEYQYRQEEGLQIVERLKEKLKQQMKDQLKEQLEAQQQLFQIQIAMLQDHFTNLMVAQSQH